MTTAIPIAVVFILVLSHVPSDSNCQPLALYTAPDVCDIDKCDTIVSMCKLTKRCSCDFKMDLHCAKDCIDCLEEKFGNCCHCIDNLCPSPRGSLHPSHVGLTSNSDEQLFRVLTEEDDQRGRWKVSSKSETLKLSHPDLGELEMAYRHDGQNSLEPDMSHDPGLQKLNCTVAFINTELSIAKCKRSCSVMGASYFRWFHVGCCECIGKYCLYDGEDVPKCDLEDL